MKLRVGSRDSRLAVLQSEQVMTGLRSACPQLELELVTMKTTGDLILDRTLEQIGGKGLFVKELDRALRQGEVDLTVHSLKDMPMETPDDLPIVAYTYREDPRDVLVLPEGVSALNPEKPIGCSSRRRQLQLAALYPEMEVQPVRGNLQTRLAKLDGGQFSALVLAAAGLKRLGLEHRISRYFTPEEILPAAGQGIIAVQGRAGEEVAALSAVRSADAGFCAQAERAFVRTLNGGCTSPVAAYAQCRDGVLTLTGLYVSSDESVVRRGTVTGLPEEGEALGRALAQKLKEGDL
jgi:hydroxymethylbilane synthase